MTSQSFTDEVVQWVKLAKTLTLPVDLENGGYARAQMPQIEQHEKPKFFADIQSEGISTTPFRIAPTMLKPIQNEIDPDKVQGILDGNPDGIPDSMGIITTSDNHIIDGHHTWAASLSRVAMNPAETVPVFQLSTDWKTGLQVGLLWDSEYGIPHQSIKSENQ